MTIRFGEYKKRDISFLLNFVTNPFLSLVCGKEAIEV